MILEICCGDITSVDSALKGGADRIELCSSLSTGGVTPSAGLLSQALWKSERRIDRVPINVLIRPRSGDSLYSDQEIRCIVEDVAYAIGAGSDGIVFGALNSDGTIDEFACSKVLEAVEKCSTSEKRISLTFHRAFDMCKDPFEALETIIKLGFDRILTSGLAPTAESGSSLIRELILRSAGRISIMPGGGVTVGNISEIIKMTGASEIHASAKSLRHTRMKFYRQGVEMGADSDEFSWYETSVEKVRELKETIG